MSDSTSIERKIEYCKSNISISAKDDIESLMLELDHASDSVSALRSYGSSFSEALVGFQKSKKISNSQLANASLVGEKTIQRLRNDQEYPTTLQTVLALCFGLKLSVAEAEYLIDLSDFKLNYRKSEGYAYKCILPYCNRLSIYEINTILESSNLKLLGSERLD